MTQTETALSFTKHYTWEEVLDEDGLLGDARPAISAYPEMQPRAVCICHRLDADSVEGAFMERNGMLSVRGGAAWAVRVYLSTTMTGDLMHVAEVMVPAASANDTDTLVGTVEEILGNIPDDSEELEDLWAGLLCNAFSEAAGCGDCPDDCMKCPFGDPAMFGLDGWDELGEWDDDDDD